MALDITALRKRQSRCAMPLLSFVWLEVLAKQLFGMPKDAVNPLFVHHIVIGQQQLFLSKSFNERQPTLAIAGMARTEALFAFRIVHEN